MEGACQFGHNDILPLVNCSKGRVGVWQSSWLGFAVAPNVCQSCHEIVASVWLFGEERGVQVFKSYTEILRRPENTL